MKHYITQRNQRNKTAKRAVDAEVGVDGAGRLDKIRENEGGEGVGSMGRVIIKDRG